MRNKNPFLVYNAALELIETLQPALQAVLRHDRSLGDQLRRAATSIALNLAESSASRDGNRRARLQSALGSTYETRSALQIARAWHYFDGDTAASLDAQLDHIGATIWRILHPA